MECLQRGVGGRGTVGNAVLQLIEEGEKGLGDLHPLWAEVFKTIRPERETGKAMAHGSPMSFRNRGEK